MDDASIKTSDEPQKLSDLLQELLDNTEDSADGDGDVTVGDVLDAVRHRSFGPLLLIIAIIAVSPVGAIPGMSIVTGSLIVLIAGQALVGRDHAWLPKRATSFSLSRDKLERGVNRVLPWIKRSEVVVTPRLTFLTEPPFVQMVAAICIVLAATFYPLAMLPFAVAAPGTAIVFLSLGLTARDGVLILLGFAGACVAGYLLWAYWPFG